MTDKQIKDILDDIVIIVDTREKKNEHILKYLYDNGIKHIVDKLDSGDYSIMLPNYPELELDRKFLVEKKNSLDEISQNFTKHRSRFAREFERAKPNTIHIVIENATWRKLLNGSYRSKFSPKSFMASLLTWCVRYRSPIWFVTPTDSPEVIYHILFYELYEYLKQNR